MMPFTPDNGPRVEVIPNSEIVTEHNMVTMLPTRSYLVSGFRAVCSCDWSGTFYAADDDHDSHDRAHADATTEADEHAVRHGR